MNKIKPRSCDRALLSKYKNKTDNRKKFWLDLYEENKLIDELRSHQKRSSIPSLGSFGAQDLYLKLQKLEKTFLKHDKEISRSKKQNQPLSSESNHLIKNIQINLHKSHLSSLHLSKIKQLLQNYKYVTSSNCRKKEKIENIKNSILKQERKNIQLKKQIQVAEQEASKLQRKTETRRFGKQNIQLQYKLLFG